MPAYDGQAEGVAPPSHALHLGAQLGECEALRKCVRTQSNLLYHRVKKLPEHRPVRVARLDGGERLAVQRRELRRDQRRKARARCMEVCLRQRLAFDPLTDQAVGGAIEEARAERLVTRRLVA